MHYVFVVDTSMSMLRAGSNGLSMLDIAKNSIEHFCRIRSRVSSVRSTTTDETSCSTSNGPGLGGDRFFLVSCNKVEVGWNTSLNHFIHKLKNLKANGLTELDKAITNAFDLLAKYRHRIPAIDNYGQGRVPWFCEPAIIIVLTDGGYFSNESGRSTNMKMHSSTLDGADLSREPYRWDQRVYTAQLKLTEAQKDLSKQTVETAVFDATRDFLKGNCKTFATSRALLSWIEFIALRIGPAIVTKFIHTSAIKTFSPSAASSDKMSNVTTAILSVVTDKGNWPLPENYLPEITMKTLPARTAIPLFHYRHDVEESCVREEFPYDKYDIESGTLTNMFFDSSCRSWSVFCKHSLGTHHSQLQSDFGHPFAIIKANSSNTGISLFVLPYNFPALFSVLDQAKSKQQSDSWRPDLSSYFKTVPFYYCPAIRAAFQRVSLHLFVSEVVEQCGGLHQDVRLYLENLRKKANSLDEIGHNAIVLDSTNTETRNTNIALLPARSDASTNAGVCKSLQRDLCSVAPDELLVFIKHLQANKTLLEKKDALRNEQQHNLPVSVMGNYHNTLMSKEIPRDPFSDDEDSNRKVNFGNRYRRNKVSSNRPSLQTDEEKGENSTKIKPTTPPLCSSTPSCVSPHAKGVTECDEPIMIKMSPAQQQVWKTFWRDNCIGELFWRFTEQIQGTVPDFSTLQTRLTEIFASCGAAFTKEIVELLRKQAGEYTSVTKYAHIQNKVKFLDSFH